MRKRITKMSFYAFLLGNLLVFNGTAAVAQGQQLPVLSTTHGVTPMENVRIYHVDATQGDDANDGLSEGKAWKTLKNVKGLVLNPGDQLLFKRGEQFNGVLEISAQGTEAQPVTIGAYGEGDRKPLISAPDKSMYAIRLSNSDYVTLEHLEVVNHGKSELAGRTGVWVECKDYGVSKGIRLNDLFVRDVNGVMAKKINGKSAAGSGIFISNGNSKGGKISTYDGLTIEYCHIKNCYRNAMIWDGCWDRTNWHVNKNVLVRYNLIEEVPGDGIVPIGCDGAIIEYNVMRNGTEKFDPNSRSEAAAGFWPWSCDNTIIRFNEVSGHKAPWDGQGFDADYSCSNTVIEYNYSHDNWGGMVLVCAAGDEAKYDYCWGNIKPIVQYNISIGDGNRPHPARGKMFSPSIHIGGPVDGLNLYRNIVHNKKKAADNIDRRMLVSDDWVGCANNTTIKENIFYAPEESGFDLTNSKNNHITGNYYLGSYKNYLPQQGGLPMTEAYEKFVTDSGQSGLMQLMDSVTIAGGAQCVFVNKKKVEDFFQQLVPDPEFSAYAEPYYWAAGAVGALPEAETKQLLSQKTKAAAESYVASVKEKVVKFDDTHYYRLKNYVRDLAQGNGKHQGSTGFMGNTRHEDWTKAVAEVSCHGADMSDANVIWAFEKIGDTENYKIKNLNTGLYLAQTHRGSASTYLTFTDVDHAGAYNFKAFSNVLAQYQVACTTGNASHNQLHASGAGVMNYNTGANDASSWYLIPATRIEVNMALQGAKQYTSMCFPFDVTCADSDLKFYGVQAIDETKGEVTMAEMAGAVAGQGAVLTGDKASYVLTIQGAAKAPSFDNLLKGTNEELSLSDNHTYFVLGKWKGAAGLCKAKGTKLQKNQAFLPLSASTSVQGFSFNFDPITGIESVVTPEVNGEAVYYDLSGRRVAHPVHGIYLCNGKKVYIK